MIFTTQKTEESFLFVCSGSVLLNQILILIIVF